MADHAAIGDAARVELAELLEALSGALSDELAALRKRDVEQLTAAVQHKAALIAALNTATGKYCRDGQPLPAAWADVRRLAAQCAEANRVNGGAIELNRGMVSRLVEIAHGGRLGAATYSASGRIQRRDASRPVGLA